jgi:hypothetical protein
MSNPARIVALGRLKCESRLVFLIFLAAYRDRNRVEVATNS